MAKVVVLSGAGISAESGISTFRDSGGLWEEYDVRDVCTIGCLEINRDETIEFYDKRRVELADKKPNKAHKVLASLKKRYKDEITIITQNVDNLFEKAGLEQQEVVHLHGELTKVQCQECGTIYDIGYKKVQESFNGKCPSCFSTKIRPFIVMFGEEAPNYVKLYEELQGCELLVVIGTSGQVISTDELLEFVKTSVLNNLEPSNAIDEDLYTHVFYEKATEAIDEIANIINKHFEIDEELYLPIIKNGLWGVVDTNGEIVISPQYEYLEINGYFPRNFFKVIRENEHYGDDEYYFINSSNKVVSDPIPFDKKRVFTPDYASLSDKKQLLFALCEESKAVFYNYEGKKVFATQYDYVEEYTLFKNNVMKVVKDEKFGLIDRDGYEIVAPQYEYIVLDRYQDEEDNYSIAYLYDENEKVQFIDLRSGFVSLEKYEIVSLHSENILVVQKNGRWGIEDRNEKCLLEPKCSNIIDEYPYLFHKKLAKLLEYDLTFLDQYESFVLSENYIIAYNDSTSKIYKLDQNEKQFTLLFA